MWTVAPDHASPLWVSKPIELFEATRWFGCSNIEGLFFFSGSAPFDLLSIAVYNSYMHQSPAKGNTFLQGHNAIGATAGLVDLKLVSLSEIRRSGCEENKKIHHLLTLFPFCCNLHSSSSSWIFHGFSHIFPHFSHPKKEPLGLPIRHAPWRPPRYDDTRIRPWNKHNIRLRKDGASLGASGVTSWMRLMWFFHR